MATAIVRHTVENFENWVEAFNGNRSFREGHGATGHRVLRDGNRVVVLVDFPEEAAVRTFVNDPALREVMKNAGVSDVDIAVLSDVDQASY
jgi:uncharacterized protein (DUF1330 family)